VAGDQAEWGYVEHLLATVVDVLQIGNWMFASANSKNRVERPKPLTRPGIATEADSSRFGTPTTKAEMRALLSQWRAGSEEVTCGD
jgi:hypothetical protein